MIGPEQSCQFLSQSNSKLRKASKGGWLQKMLSRIFRSFPIELDLLELKMKRNNAIENSSWKRMDKKSYKRQNELSSQRHFDSPKWYELLPLVKTELSNFKPSGNLTIPKPVRYYV